jgi:hypothetical protein
MGGFAEKPRSSILQNLILKQAKCPLFVGTYEGNFVKKLL